MNVPNIARATIDILLAISWRQILEQFDFVSGGRFHNREFDLSAGHSRNLTGHFARLMRAMRKLKAENILPKFERAIEIRNCDASMIGGDNSKWHRAHPTAAMTLSSIAIGVGSAVTSTVVRVGVGLPAPAKYSA